MRLLTLFISCVLVLQVCPYRPANNDELDELLDEFDTKQEDQVNKRHYHRQRNILDDDDENEIDYDLDDFVSDEEEDDDPDNYSQHFNANHRSDFDSNAEDEFENDGKRRQPFEEQHQDLKSKSHSKKQIIKLDEIKTSTLPPITAKPTTKAPPTTTTPPPTTTRQPTTTNTQPSPKTVPIATSEPSSANRKRPMYNRRYRLQLLLKRLRSLRRMRERTSQRHHKKYFGRYLKKYHPLEILQRYGCHRISCVRHHSSLCICRDRRH
ncbi:uncharacterized protein [Clytia hemisphaerica]|uniref:Cnidarian restricted protein n=1 Tax=Clytia hemisphaerica TaxID=252671 RepID=A0A7M5WRR8_9CNID|eukprot:TCONS_00059173-protein